MGIIETRWRQRLCLSSYGVYFGADSFLALHGTPETGFLAASVRVSIITTLQEPISGWIDLYESCLVQSEEHSIFAGTTSWEGDGFVAVELRQCGQLLWLLHLHGTEQFTRIACDGLTIDAVSEEYPHRAEWSIPLQSPECLMVSHVHVP